MADIVYIDSGNNTPISTDYVNIGGIDQHVQRMKLLDGTNNSSATISGDATYGLDVDVTRIPSITLNSQANPFTTALPISDNNGSLTVDGSLLVNDSTITVTGGSLPVTQSGNWNVNGSTISITGSLPVGSNNIGDIDVLTLPNITLASQVSPFSTPLNISGFISISGGTVTVTGSTLAISSIAAGDNNIGNIDVLTLPSVVLASQVNPFTSPLNVSGLIQAVQSGSWNIQNSTIAITGSLPTGTNNIGDIDVLTEPATATGGATVLPTYLKILGGWDGSNINVLSVDSSGAIPTTISQSVSVLTQGSNFLRISGIRSSQSHLYVLDGGDTVPISHHIGSESNYALDTYIANNYIPVTQSGNWNFNGTSVTVTGGSVNIAAIAAGDTNIGNVDVVSLPSANLGQQAMSASLSCVPANNITDATYIGDIKFGEGLPTSTANIGTVNGSTITVTGVLPAGSNNIGDVDVLTLPNITLASQTNPFTTPLNVSGAINQNGTWNIDTLSTLTNVVHVDDNSSSLTVDGIISINGGTITVTGSTITVGSITAGDNNIGNVDIVSLPAGNLGMQAMSASLSMVPANNITDATYIGDIKFGEGLQTGTANIGTVNGSTISVTGSTLLSAIQTAVENKSTALSAALQVSGLTVSGTDTNLFNAPSAGNHHEIYHLKSSNHGGEIRFQITNGSAGNTIGEYTLAASGGGFSEQYNPPIKLGSATALYYNYISNAYNPLASVYAHFKVVAD